MNTHEGYSKKTISNANVLLAGGGDKSLSDFLSSIQYVSASKKIQYKTAADNASWQDLVTLVTTDENVKLTPKTDNANRPLMMINGGTSAGELTSTSMFSTGIYANASSKMITSNGYIKAGYDDTSVLLAGGGVKTLDDFILSNRINELLNSEIYYGLENLALSVTGNGRCTTADGGKSVVTAGSDGDTYFTINTSEPIYPDLEYTLGFKVENWPSGVTGTWGFPPGQQSNGSNWQIIVDGNGWFWGTGKFPSANGSTYSLFMDDNIVTGSIRNYSIKFTNFVLVKGNIKAHYQPPINSRTWPWSLITNTPDFTTRWPSWDEVTNKPTEFNPSSHTHAYLDYSGDITALGTSSPLSTVKTWVTSTNLPNSFKILYDSSGTEYSMLFTFRPGNLSNGAILRWGYTDTYIRMARRVNGTWQSEDWEKISAGYADSAGDASTLGGTSKSGLLTDFSRTANTNNLSITVGGTSKSVTLGSLAFDSTPYLPLAGGTMTGDAPITFTNSKIGLAFPGDGPSFEARIMFQSESYESLTFAQKNSNSSFIFATGLDLANGTNWSTHAPTLHIKNKSVYINTNIGTGNSVPAYTFYVNGGAGFGGGIDMGCPLTISGGCGRKLYFKDTDGEKWSLISFLDKNGSEYGLLGVHGDSNLRWNSNIIYHTGNLPAYPTKNSWNYDDRYVTAVGAGGSGHTNEIYYTKNGSNTYFTVPYSSNSGALEGNSLNNVIKRNGSRNCVSMKPAAPGGKTSISGFTVVAYPKTNLGDTYYFIKATTNIPAGKYIFSIRSSGFSGTDHWVFYFLNSSAIGGVDCRNGWASNIINISSLISAGSNILIDDASSGSAANSSTVVFSEWMLTPIDEGTYMPAPEDLVHLYGGQTIDGNLTATNFYTTSDRNKKTNISSFSEHIRKFQLKDTEKWHYGVIAQEVEEMFRDGEEGNMTVNYNSVLSFYIGQLENRVKMLEERIKRLESK